MKKLLILIFCMFLLVGTVNAYDFDNKLKYEDNDMKVTIENIYGFGSDLGSLELTSHKSVNEIKQVPIGNDVLVMSYDFNFKDIYSNGIGDISFIDVRTGKEISKDYNLKYKSTEEVEVNDYETQCQDKLNVNGSYSKVCNSVVTGTHNEKREIWLTYNSKDIPKGKITLGLFTDVKLNDYVDGIWEIAGKKISKHAVWSSSLNVNLISYYKLDSTAGTIAIDSTNNYNGTLVNMEGDEWATGIINNAVEVNYDVANDEYVNFGDNTHFDSIQSLSLWWNNTDSGGSVDGRTIWGKENVTNSTLLYIDSTQILRFFNATTNKIAFESGPGLTRNTWHHIVMTFDGTNVTLYLDGNQNATGVIDSPASVFSSIHNLTIGGSPTGRTSKTILDEFAIWNRSLTSAEVTQLYNSGNAITYESIGITLNSPDDASSTINRTIDFNCSIDPLYTLANVSLLINGVINQTNSSGLQGEYIFTDTYGFGSYNWTCQALTTGSIKNTATNRSLAITRFVENSITYESEVFEGESTIISGNFTLAKIPTNISFTYNGNLYTPTITTYGSIYIVNATVITPTVTVNTNKTFYYTFLIDGIYFNSSLNNQTVLNIGLTTVCDGNYSIINLTNYDEGTLTLMNGTVEYVLTLSNDLVTLTTLNGTNNGTLIQLCSSENISESNSYYSLELRYYYDGYVYETYNIPTTSTSNLPLSIYLYYLNTTAGTEFKIDYKDYKYLSHPGAIIQIQKQYLALDQYRVVEIPMISDDGTTTGSFETTGIRYKLIIIEDGEILDTFTNIFPKCQNAVLGTCEINILGDEESTTTSEDDFEYSLVDNETAIEITYIIPSGTPKLVHLFTNQSSIFLNEISTCNQSSYASGGTLFCPYNHTVGESNLFTAIYINNEIYLQGNLKITENINALFLSNNYFIGFILLLTLVLIFVTDGVAMVVSATVGLFFLGFIYLIKSNSLGITMVVGSLVWLLIAVGLIIYKIAQKEERT